MTSSPKAVAKRQPFPVSPSFTDVVTEVNGAGIKPEKEWRHHLQDGGNSYVVHARQSSSPSSSIYYLSGRRSNWNRSSASLRMRAARSITWFGTCPVNCAHRRSSSATRVARSPTVVRTADHPSRKYRSLPVDSIYSQSDAQTTASYNVRNSFCRKTDIARKTKCRLPNVGKKPRGWKLEKEK